MPGLLRGVARTAVIAGTASAVSGRVQRRQAERFAERDAGIYAQRQQAYEQQVDAAQPPPAAAPTETDVITQLQQLGKLRDDGVLTEDEFASQKARILGS
ncbi:MAG TPA: SHOCT domain-containing protein [Euzebyales bacterium]